MYDMTATHLSAHEGLMLSWVTQLVGGHRPGIVFLVFLVVVSLVSSVCTASVEVSVECHYGDNQIYLHDFHNDLSVVARFDPQAYDAQLRMAEGEITQEIICRGPGPIREWHCGLYFKSVNLSEGTYSLEVTMNYTQGVESYNISRMLSFDILSDFEFLGLIGPSEVSQEPALIRAELNVLAPMRNVTALFFGVGVEFEPSTLYFDELSPGVHNISSEVNATEWYPRPDGFYSFSISGFVDGHKVAFTADSVDVALDTNDNDPGLRAIWIWLILAVLGTAALAALSALLYNRRMDMRRG